jgi:hypothetical protein
MIHLIYSLSLLIFILFHFFPLYRKKSREKFWRSYIRNRFFPPSSYYYDDWVIFLSVIIPEVSSIKKLMHEKGATDLQMNV